MEEIKLIGLDLDGTLLDDRKQISPRTLAALEAAAQKGVCLAPVTGRPHQGIPQLVRDLPFVRYLISCNGASTWDKAEGRFVRESLISPADSLALVQLLNRHSVAFEVIHQGVGYAEGWVYEGMLAASPNPEFLRKYIHETRKIVPSLADFLARGDLGLEELFVMAGSRSRREELAGILEEFGRVNMVFPTPATLELTAKGVDKGVALLDLAARLGIAQASVMALGDSGNDLAMLRAAAFPVAMGNAAREVKEMARFTTASNEAHGVALAIERFVLA